MEAAFLFLDRASCDYGLSDLRARHAIRELFAPLDPWIDALGVDRGEESVARSRFFAVCAALVFPAYFAAVWLVGRFPRGHRGALAVILLAAAAFRLTLLPFPPLMESSFNRYVWDGVVTSKGINPFRWSPEQIEKAKDPAFRNLYPEPERTELRVLNLESREDLATAHYFRNVTFRQLRSIYPPLSQLVWGICGTLAPGSGLAIKLANVLFDLAVVAVVLALLIRIGANPCMVVVYAWSPLVCKEFANSGHGDVHAVLFTMLGLYYLVAGRPLFAAAGLALGSLAKVFPLAILLVLARSLKRQGLVLAGGIVLIAALPMVDVSGTMHDGMAAYARRWEHNGSLYPAIRWVLTRAGVEKDPAFKKTYFTTPREEYELHARATLSRAVAAGLALLVLVWLATRPQETPRQVLALALAGIATVQLFSPVLLPWYFTWGIPLLSVFPLRSFLYLSCSIAVGWYATHALDGRPDFETIKTIAQLLEYLPFYVMLYFELRPRFVTSKGA